MTGFPAFEHGGNIYEANRRLGKQDTAFLDFSANINPLGLADSVRVAIEEALPQIIHYPDATAYALKTAISRHYHVPFDTITVGNGAVEPIYILCHMIRPTRVGVLAPTFSEYERAARACGAVIEYLPLTAAEKFALDTTAICRRLPELDMLFLGNPNNPSGCLLPPDCLTTILTTAKQHNVWLVIDESFIDFIPEQLTYTARKYLADYERLVIIHSLTKFYALPGLRLGFALTTASLTERLHAGKDPWNVNNLAQAAGIAALADTDYQQQTRAIVAQNRLTLYQQLQKLPGIKAFEPSVNFILLDISQTRITASELCRRLQTMGILLRNCSNYPGLDESYVRVAVKQDTQNQQLLQALSTVIGDVLK